jgi:hypothetical protein
VKHRRGNEDGLAGVHRDAAGSAQYDSGTPLTTCRHWRMNMPASYLPDSTRQDDLLSLHHVFRRDLAETSKCEPTANDLRQKGRQTILTTIVSALGLGKLG